MHLFPQPPSCALPYYIPPTHTPAGDAVDRVTTAAARSTAPAVVEQDNRGNWDREKYLWISCEVVRKLP